MPASIQILNGKARLVIPSRGGIAAIGGSQVPGATGKSAYQSYLDTTADDPVLTEEEWSEGGGGGGDYLPLAGGTMDANATITWGNASAIREAGAQGLEIECSVGYRWQFVAGRMILRQINSGQIQRVLAIDGVTPGDTEDISEGFIVGTRWETQDGTIYECTDSTDGAAVWVDITPLQITGTGIAYVRTGGNNTTGTIGNPSLPYLTAQAAWDDGARAFELGDGSYTITHTSAEESVPTAGQKVIFRGLGKDRTTLALTWTGTTGYTGAADGGTGGAGAKPEKLNLWSDGSVGIDLTLSGGIGGVGGEGTAGTMGEPGGTGGTGGTGGAGPDYVCSRCWFTALSSTGGAGGAGGAGGVSNGAGAGADGEPGTSAGKGEGGFYWCNLSDDYDASGEAIYACLQNELFLGPVRASDVSYGVGSTVDAALNTLATRAITEHYMRTSDFTSSSAVVSNVTGLACSVAANEKLLIEIVGFQAGGASGDGFRICFTGPASPTHVRYSFSHFTNTATLRTDAPATSFGTDVVDNSGTNISLPFTVTLTLINGSNPGTIQFKAGAETTTTTSTTISTGCTMRVHRIP